MTPTTTPTLTRSLVKTSLYILRAKAMQRKVSRIWRTCFLLFVDSGYRIPDTGFRIPDSGFRFPVPVSCSGFRFPGFGVALNGPEKPQEECPITSNVLMFQYVPIRAELARKFFCFSNRYLVRGNGPGSSVWDTLTPELLSMQLPTRIFYITIILK